MATAAKKPASKPESSNAKKPAGKVAEQAKPVTQAAASKAKAQIDAAKPAPASAKAKEKPVVVKPVPEKPKAAPSSRVSAKPAVAKPAPVAEQQQVLEKPAKQPMKTAETKIPTAKTAAAKPVATKSTAKASKKAVAIPQSDAELMAMSESDYMNDAQLAYFKAKLTVMRDEILENARETGEHLKENEVFADPNDRATVEEENLLEQRVRDRERKLLKKINSSLARIEAGEYGYCQETGDPIGLPRLLARPTADLSIEAQEKHERLEKLYAD